VAFQGTQLNGNLTPTLNLGVMYIPRFRARANSAFNANTLLTSCDTAFPTGKGPIVGVAGTFTVPGDPCNKPQHSQGFLQFSAQATFPHIGLAAQAYQYEIYDITTMTYVNAVWNFNKGARANPYVAGQFLDESSTGNHLVGLVHNSTYGGQFGATIAKNLNLIVGYNGSPALSSVVAAQNCGTASSPKAASTRGVFGGVSDTSTPGLPPRLVTCWRGGIASPYTDNYATDPLYTTQISQGLADVHKPGTGSKIALAWQSNDKRLRILASNACGITRCRARFRAQATATLALSSTSTFRTISTTYAAARTEVFGFASATQIGHSHLRRSISSTAVPSSSILSEALVVRA